MRVGIHRGSVLLALLFVAVGTLHSQTLAASQGVAAPAAVTILLDLSYSMRLPLGLNKDDVHATTRLAEAKRLLGAVIDRGRPGTRWALLTFGGEPAPGKPAGAVDVVQGYTTDAQKLKGEIRRLPTWGLSPLGSAILAADRYASEGSGGGQRILLVVSDGIDTVPALYELPSPAVLRALAVPVVFAGIELERAPALAAALRGWVDRAGGLYAEAADPASVLAAIGAPAQLPRRERPAETGSGAASAEKAALLAPPHATVPHPGVAPLRSFLPFLLGCAAALPLLLLLPRRRRWKRECARVRSLRRREVVSRWQREAKGEVKRFESGARRISLVPAGWARPTSVLPVVEVGESGALLTSPGPIVINGVGVRRKLLEAGDRIHIPGFLWIFRGVETCTVGGPDPLRPKALPHLLATLSLALVAGSLFLGYPVGISGANGAARVSTSRAEGLVTKAQPPAPAARSAPKPAQAEEVSLLGGLAVVRPLLHTQMVAPGVQPHFFKADMMFIHAHPDDESINFGALMAMEARAGKRIVSVVFTDGGAGLDQYPYRRVGGIYPDHALSGRALARVRVDETESALSILGSVAYVRLGLRNNPYDSVTEILPLGEILRRWGGETHVVDELAGLIAGYRPQIVVSPDESHRGVFTHFEHEAVGYVTDAALSLLRSRGEDFVRAHLIGVDPMLTHEYRGVFGIDAVRTDPVSGLTYRAIQVAALEQHRSQRDASVIAVEVVPNFDEEYYVAQYWKLPVPPRRYFSVPTTPARLPETTADRTEGFTHHS